MRHYRLAVLAVVALLVVGLVPAHAVVGIGVTVPLYSVDHTDATAGGNYLINFDPEATPDAEHHAAWYLDGALKIFVDKYGLFNELRYMSVDFGVLRIEEKHLKSVESDIRAGKLQNPTNAVLYLKDGRIVINCALLGTGQYVLVTNIKQDQSTRNAHGILASLGQLIGIKKTRHIEKTDVVAMRFEITDISSTIERLTRLQFKCEPCKMDDDQRYILRAAFYQEALRDRIGFADYPGLLELVSQGYAASVQGYNPPLSRDQGPNQEVVALQKAYNELLQKFQQFVDQRDQDAAQAERERVSAAEAALAAQRAAASAPVVIDPVVAQPQSQVVLANASWTLVLPTGRKYCRIRTSNPGGDEAEYVGNWSGTLRFSKATPGTIYIQLVGIAGPEPWRIASITDGCTVNYSTLKEAK